MAGADGKDGVARALGWFSLALGAAQVAVPGRVAELAGVEGDRRRLVVRAVGLRELATGAGIVACRRPTGWLWARVAGDALDLALLALAPGRWRWNRIAAVAAVGGATAADVAEGVRLTRSGGRTPIEATKTITVNRHVDEVYARWRALGDLPRFMTHLEAVEERDERLSRWRAHGPAGRTLEWEAEIVDDRPGELIAWRSLPGGDVDTQGMVRFVPAPGGRGTEVRVELRYAPPAGRAGAAVAKLLGADPATRLADDLRRFKQVLETGEVVRSDSTPSGHDLAQHLQQRAARPEPQSERQPEGAR